MTWREFESRVHRKLLSLGWDVRRAAPAPQGWASGRAYWEPEYLKGLGFNPGTLIDVGVAGGTPQLYRAFPDAYLVLIEPLTECVTDIEGILRSRPGEHVPVALGQEPGVRNLRVEPREPSKTSFYERHRRERTGDTPAIRQVAVDTLDRVMSARRFPRPFGLKIDAEGAELEILHGAAATLSETEFVIVEAGMGCRFHGGCGLADLVGELDRNGFRAVDILDIGRDATSRAAFLDLVFERRHV